jgi:hypothetical protein
MIARSLGSALPAVLVALIPKCPACLGAYLAIGSSLGLGRLDPGVLWGVMICGLVGSLALLGLAASRRHRWGAFAVACAGAAIVLGGRLAGAGRFVLIAGVAVLYAGALRIYVSRLTRSVGCKRGACPST